MKKNPAVFLLTIIFSLIGFFMLFGAGASAFLLQKSASRAVPVDAVIDQIRETSSGSFQVFVTYELDGRIYEHVPLSEYSSSMYEGKALSLLCSPDDPRQVHSGFVIRFIPLILGGIGLIFLTVGGVFLWILLRRRNLESDLLQNGTRITGLVEKIRLCPNYTVNGRHPYVVICSYEDPVSHMIYRFKSGSIWTDPRPVLDAGSSVPVYVTPGRYSRYFVDVQSILDRHICDYT